MKNIRLINVHINSVIFSQCVFINILLNRSDIMVNKKLFAQNITGKASNSLIYRNNIGIKAADKIIQRIKRRYGSTG